MSLTKAQRKLNFLEHYYDKRCELNSQLGNEEISLDKYRRELKKLNTKFNLK